MNKPPIIASGKISRTPFRSEPGQITDAGGLNYTYLSYECFSGAPELGDTVEFVADGTAATRIVTVQKINDRSKPTLIVRGRLRRIIQFYFTRGGRIGFLDFWVLGAAPIFSAQYFLVAYILPSLLWQAPWDLYETIYFAQIATLFYIKANVCSKRCHDVGYSGLLAWLCTGAVYSPSFLMMPFNDQILASMLPQYPIDIDKLIFTAKLFNLQAGAFSSFSCFASSFAPERPVRIASARRRYRRWSSPSVILKECFRVPLTRPTVPSRSAPLRSVSAADGSRVHPESPSPHRRDPKAQIA